MGNIFSISCDGALLLRCLDCSIRKAAYINELQDNVAALHTKLEELIAERNSVERRVNLAKQQRKEVTEPVKLWLSKVQAVESEVADLKKVESQEIEKLCLRGYCSRNCKSSYKFGKRVVDKLKEVTDLKAEGGFGGVAQEILEDPFNEIPMDPNIVGQQSMFDNVWSCLKEEEFRIFGLYGPGGVGKTTLLKQIHNNFCNEGLHFDVVIWTVVSKGRKLEKVQEDIGKEIGLYEDSWSEKSLEVKARDICKFLKKKKFGLLLDDIWEPIDLFNLGVPSSKPSKVVFTTRFSGVCGQMKVDREFKVSCLEDKDAWDLFQKNVGSDILNSQPEIPELAEKVAKECCGLPLALKTIGRAMSRKKKVEEWEDAVEVLKKSAYEFPGMEEDVYPRLKFSYDSLANQKLRSCFLYCCLFPEDYRIDQKYLIECWLAEGFLGEYDGKKAVNRGYTVIGDLVRACLLEEEEEEDGDYVVMHDVLRDMALWIACEIDKEKENLLVQAGFGINKAPESEKWEGVKRISLMENKIENLLDNPKCPDLRTLFLRSNELSIICSEFFQFLPSLRVLNLSDNSCLSELPYGISNLVSLEHLDLSFTGLVTLPEEMKKLEKLKYLSLKKTLYLCLFPRQILPKMLRTLIMEGCGYREEQKGDNILFHDYESLIEELFGLEHLNTLTIDLRNDRVLQKFSSSHKVQSCVDLGLYGIGDSQSLNVSSLAYMKHLHSLRIRYCDSKELEIDSVDSLLEIDSVDSLRQFHGFNTLNKVEVVGCYKLKDVTCLVLASNLKAIWIEYCSKMEEIINVEKLIKIQEMLGKDHQIIPFQKLEFLHLRLLSKLQSIYWRALPFECLKKIDVVECPVLKTLPLDSNSAKEGKLVILGKEDWWRNLQWEDEYTQKKFDSCFRH